MVDTKTSYKDNWYSLSEVEMQDLLFAAKHGDAKAQGELLKIFGNFISKYVELLAEARWSLQSPETRQFIALYVKDPSVRYPLLKGKMTSHGYKEVSEVVRGLQYMVQRYCDKEDVLQTVQMAFLHAVNKYERKESTTKPGEFVPFAGYINRYFKFVIKRFVDDFLIDQNGRNTYAIANDETLGWEDDSAPDGTALSLPPTSPLEDLLGADTIDEHWVIGDTCGFPFDVLNVQERQLLRWRYAEGLRTSEIAKRTSDHPNKVRSNLASIRDKLTENLSDYS